VRFIHGTTRALNAVLTGTTARTAFFTTQGHPDILLFREGGRLDPFNFAPRYPEPLIPRSLTFEIDERIGAEGDVLRALDEDQAVAQIKRACELGVESVAVSLLWSIANPANELRLAELLAEHAPHLTHTLSHQLNPIVREYRRACSTALDAALKPVMSDYLGDLQSRLSEEGLTGRLLIVTSGGGVLDAEHVSRAPVHTIGSGPAMAPVAGRDYVTRISGDRTVLVADTGGTSYDVGVVQALGAGFVLVVLDGHYQHPLIAVAFLLLLRQCCGRFGVVQLGEQGGQVSAGQLDPGLDAGYVLHQAASPVVPSHWPAT
jgi:N-methylhydantoinase A